MSVYDYGTETGGVFRGGKPVVYDIPKEDAKMRIGILIFNKQAFESAKGRLPVESDKAKIDELIAEVMNEAGVK